MSQIIFVYVTCPDIEVAKNIANQALSKRLIACANILPQMTSIYRWEGKVEEATECVMILKTRKLMYQDLRVLITKVHPYDVPCILSWDITNGNPPYMNWLEKEVSG
jgi:periplasmic divalent cation tolerance protein